MDKKYDEITAANPNAQIMLVGTKSDIKLKENFDDQIEIFRKIRDVKHAFETSAKNNLNCEKVFINAAQELIGKHLDSLVEDE